MSRHPPSRPAALPAALERRVHETATLTPIGGPLYSISSTVAVTSAVDAGNWRYAGVFNDNTLVARFVVVGRLCIG